MNRQLPSHKNTGHDPTAVDWATRRPVRHPSRGFILIEILSRRALRIILLAPGPLLQTTFELLPTEVSLQRASPSLWPRLRNLRTPLWFFPIISPSLHCQFSAATFIESLPMLTHLRVLIYHIYFFCSVGCHTKLTFFDILGTLSITL